MTCTVAISSYDAADYLGACLAQLLNQSLCAHLEIIVIDSGSSEDERSVCDKYKSQFARLIYERTQREPLDAAWNRALAKASGKYFVNANTDDALHPRAFEMLVSALDAEPEAALAYGDWMWATVPNAKFPWDLGFRRCVHPEYHPSLPLFYAYAGCHQFWRTDKLRELGGFNADYKAAGDYEALCRLALKRWKAVYVPEVVSAFYQNPNGLSRSSDVSYKEFLEIRDSFRNAFTIQDLYDVYPCDKIACANAWADLARRAFSLRIPWAERNTPDKEFAAKCARRALALEPGNVEASLVLNNTNTNSRGLIHFFHRLISKMNARTIASV